jgi:pimeloyl-ACP methyl ester carboxylesterase
LTVGYLLDALGDLGFSGVSFDFSGHGESPGVETDCTLDDRLREARGVAAALGLHRPRALIGTSMGAFVALRLAADLRPEVLILFAPALYPERLREVPFGAEFRRALETPGWYRESELLDDAAAFSGALLIVGGRDDKVTPPESFTLLHAAAERARSREIIWLERTGHGVHANLRRDPPSHDHVIATIAQRLEPARAIRNRRQETCKMNYLNSPDTESIAQIEASFASGLLHEAVETSPEIERRHKLSPEEFDTEYRSKFKPVVISGLMDDWPALRTWTFDLLAEKCGDVQVTVDSYSRRKAQKATFAEFVRMMRERTDADQEPLYLQEWLYKEISPHLIEDLPELEIADYDFRRDLYGEAISTNHQLWIGQAGATTRVHQDSYIIDVMHAQIVGEKHWSVMRPEATLHRRADGALDFERLVDDHRDAFMRAVCKPGDVIYLPALWWHRIALLSDSIGLGRKCLDQANLREHMRLRLNELLALALNHEHIRETHPEMYGGIIARNRTWARLLDLDLNTLRPDVAQPQNAEPAKRSRQHGAASV